MDVLAKKPKWIFHNWSKLQSCTAEYLYEPATVHELKLIIENARRNNKKIRVVGYGHSASDLCLTSDYLVSMKKFNKVLSVNTKACTAHVEAGITLKKLAEQLECGGLSIPVLPTIADVSVGGVMATGTHGSGINYYVLSHYVVEIELLTASGEIKKLSPLNDADLFKAAQVSLGALGIIISVVLQCEPFSLLCRRTYPANLLDILECLPVHLKSSDHFAFLWYPPSDDVGVIHVTRTTDSTFSLKRNWFWNSFMNYYVTEILYFLGMYFPVLRKWANRLRFICFDGRETVTVSKSTEICFADYRNRFVAKEWCFPLEQTTSIIWSMREWIQRTQFPVHFVEVRFVKGDDIPLSTCYKQDSVFINTNFYLPFGVQSNYGEKWDKEFERIALQHNGRPHWAKCHPLTHIELKQLYPQWDFFCTMQKQIDPMGMFTNVATKRLLG